MGKKTGKIGYFCSLVPEEIILAAGLQPVRVAGHAAGTSEADSYLYPNICPYIKDLLSTGLNGGMQDLDGIVFVRSCDGMRRLYDAWKSYVGDGYVYWLDVPKNSDEAAIAFYASRLKEFAQSLAAVSGSKLTTASLQKAIGAVAGLRRSMQNMYSLQRETPVAVKGSELFMAGREALNLDSISSINSIGELRKRAVKAVGKAEGRKPRVLVSGSVMDRPDLLELIEAAGAEIPAADLCAGLRQFNRNVDTAEKEPYLALARAYLGEPHCARTAAPHERLCEIARLIDDYSIDGVVLTALKFCDLYLYDVPTLVNGLKDKDIPVLFLENDYIFADKDRMKVRIEAFVEVLNEKGVRPC